MPAIHRPASRFTPTPINKMATSMCLATTKARTAGIGPMVQNQAVTKTVTADHATCFKRKFRLPNGFSSRIVAGSLGAITRLPHFGGDYDLIQLYPAAVPLAIDVAARLVAFSEV
jgi:hypothetical protein